jgi:hypothetical protein
MVISTSLNVLYSYLCRKYISHIHLLYFIYPPSLISALPLLWPIVHSCPSLLSCLFIIQWDFCIDIIPIHALCLSQCNSPPLHFLILSPIHVVQQFSVCFVLSFFYTGVMYFIIIHFLSFSLSLLYKSHFWVHVLYIFLCIYNIAYIYIPHMRESMRPLAFWTWLTSLKMMFSNSIHLPVNNKISFFFYCWTKIPLHINNTFS